MNTSQSPPACKVMRNPGTHQVETKTANTPPALSPKRCRKIAAARERKSQPRSEIQIGNGTGKRRRQHHEVHDVTRSRNAHNLKNVERTLDELDLRPRNNANNKCQ